MPALLQFMRAVFFAAFGGGLVKALGLDLMVARTLGIAATPENLVSILLIVSGLAGVIGTTLWEHWNTAWPMAVRRIFPALPHYRAKMELGEIACYAAGVAPTRPITSGAALTLLRVLRDAANDGRLELIAESERPYDERSETIAPYLSAYAREYADGAPFLRIARKWSERKITREVVAQLGPGQFTVAGRELLLGAVPFERQISVGEVVARAHDLEKNKLSLLITGRNASPYTVYEGNRKGAITVETISTGTPLVIGRAGHPSLHYLWRVPHTGRPPPGVPTGKDFEALVELDLSPELGAAITAEFDSGSHVQFGLSGLDICIYPEGETGNERRLELPEKVSLQRLDGHYVTRKVIIVRPPLLQSYNAPK